MTGEPSVRITEYAVSCIPQDHEDAYLFTITVKWRGDNQWAVGSRGRFLGRDGSWSFGFSWRDGTQEPVTDDEYREYAAGHDAWIADHRFGLDEALEMAKAAAPHLKVMRTTVADILARAAELEAGR